MGFFRFRKSIRIAPGIRLSLGKRGIGLSAGVKGLRASVGPRGFGLTTGIPGTGMSYTSTLGGGRRATGGRSSYRELQRRQRDEERAALVATREREKAEARAAARAEHEAHTARIEALRSVLKARVREPFAWKELTAARGPFVPEPFTVKAFHVPESLVRYQVARRQPLWPWALVGVGAFILASALALSAAGVVATGSGGARWASSAVLGVASFVLVLAVGGAAAAGSRAFARRGPERFRVVAELEREHADATLRAESAHKAAQDAARAEWGAEEEARTRLREAVERDDPEPLADLLEMELANEDFPVPIVCDVAFEGCARVLVSLELPELDDVPEEHTSLTTTFKLSRKKMAQRERVSIFEDLCCGVALRLAHEAFRVLPMLAEITVEGSFSQVSATGHDQEAIALRFQLTRERFEALELDRLDPSECLRAVGAFNCSRRGELGAIA